jgi:non-specific serine/threonine protein kinase
LGIAGEQRFPVRPLALPDEDDTTARRHDGEAGIRDIGKSAAVELFVARARAIDLRFTLRQENAATIAAICRRLNGLPLAIELAAARLRHFSPAELLARLRSTLPLLTGGPADAPDRLRTMREAIAWSYDLLSSEEQTLFRRLSMFVGGFTYDAAEWIWDDRRDGESSSSPAPASLDLVAALADKSLIHAGEAGDVTRFGMLETVREFGLDQLAERGETETIAALHAAWYARLVEDARTRIHGPDGAAVLDGLETEHSNLRAALSWTTAAGETELALRLAYAAWRFWWMRSHLEEGRSWLERALALPDSGPASAALRANTQVAAGYFARVQGDYAIATALGTQALTLAQQIGDAGGASGALHLLSLAATDSGQLAEAQTHLESGIAIDRSVDYTHGVAFGLSDLGDVALARGRLADAAGFAEEALAIWRARGDAWSVAWALIGCGRIARAQGDRARAAALLCEALDGCAKLGDKEIAARGISELAAMSAERGQPLLAARLYGSAAALREAIGAPLAPAKRADHEAAVNAIRAGLASDVFAAAWEAGRALSLDEAIAEAAGLASEAVAELTALADNASQAPVSGLGDASGLAKLTAREREILRLLIDGRSDKEIATEIGISAGTVSKHVVSIRDKLNAPSRTAAATLALRYGLI